jgi:ABC-type transport system substrate-binding protein
MTWLRRLIIVFPIALLAFFGIAFVSVRLTPPQKLNQLTIGSIGEAKILNPIKSTTTADSEITDHVFQGLVKYDENINTVGDLAEKWEVTQKSTLFFSTRSIAEQALHLLVQHRADWPQWNVTDTRVDGQSAILELSEAGTSFQDTVLSLLGKEKPLTVSFVRVSLADGAQFDGKPATSQRLLPRIDTEIKLTPGVADRIHSHFTNSSSEFDLVVIGDAEPIVKIANTLLKADQGKAALGTCEVAETFPVLNEPEILFHLRHGVRWHDGKPFTARDVEFTYKAILDEDIASPRRPDYELVRSFDVVDDFTVRIIYRKPYSPSLLSWSMGVLPKHILEGHDSQWWAANFNRSPIGTGPYKFEEWKSNQYIRLKRNDDYWEGKPHFDFVTVRTIPDLVALRLSFETREVDYWGVEPHANQRYKSDPRYETFSRITPAFEYVGWNLRRPMFQDKRVRQALAHAVNVKQMIDFIYYGEGVQSTGPFPPQMWYSNPNVKPFEYDPEKARAMLSEAGWKPGPDGILQKDGKKFEFTLITNHPNEIRKDIATLVQSDLKKVGIKVEVQLYEWAVFISQYINKQDFDAMVLGWQLGYDYDQYQLWHSSQTKPGMLNHCSYVNKEVDRLLELARSEFDEDKAKQYLWKLNEIIYDDQPYLFTTVPKATTALHRGEYRVKRPDGKGGWIEEPLRSTKVGLGVYEDWWYRPKLTP